MTTKVTGEMHSESSCESEKVSESIYDAWSSFFIRIISLLVIIFHYNFMLPTCMHLIRRNVYLMPAEVCLLDIFVRHLMQIALSRNVANVVNVRCLTSIKHFNQRLSRQNKLFTLLVQSAVVLINHVPVW